MNRFLQVNRRRGLAAPAGPSPAPGTSADRPIPWKYAVAAVIGSPMTSSVSVSVNTHGGSAMFCVSTSITWSRTQEPAAYKPRTFHRERWCAGRDMAPLTGDRVAGGTPPPPLRRSSIDTHAGPCRHAGWWADGQASTGGSLFRKVSSRSGTAASGRAMFSGRTLLRRGRGPCDRSPLRRRAAGDPPPGPSRT